MSHERITAALVRAGLPAPEIGESNNTAYEKLADALERLVAVTEAAMVVDDLLYEGAGGRPSLHELHKALTALRGDA